MAAKKLASVNESKGVSQRAPLAEQIRPHSWDDFQSFEGLNPKLMQQLRSGTGRPPSLILWGPPGTGKTTFARLVGSAFKVNFVEVSAVLVGVKEVREIIEIAKTHELPTILFVDEIHRFNKGQQDAFLPHVESGVIALIGATTENPSFYCTSALLSRTQVLVFKSLSADALQTIATRGAQEVGISLDQQALQNLVQGAAGDARKLLNLIETLKQALGDRNEVVTPEILSATLQDSRTLFYDRAGEEHYNVVSAFIKSMRGSDPDAALYWAFRMIESGEDPRFVIRRMIIFASEDISNADPRALDLAIATADAFDRIGLPEGKIPLAQCITYLACAPKSNRSYMAMHRAVEAVSRYPKVDVPIHLRNAPTKLMKNLGYGKDYDYPHDTEEGYIPGVQYLPDELRNASFYEPSQHGIESKIAARLKMLKEMKAK